MPSNRIKIDPRGLAPHISHQSERAASSSPFAFLHTHHRFNNITMSSWDRTRLIPWSRATPVAPPSLDLQKEDVDLNRERVFRDLSREAANEAKDKEEERKRNKSQQHDISNNEVKQQSDIAINNKNKPELNFLGYQGRPYQTSDLLRNTAFGATIGSITGMCFGFMDSMRSATSSSVLKSASRSAQGKFIFQVSQVLSYTCLHKRSNSH